MSILRLRLSVYAELGEYLQQRNDSGDDYGLKRWLVLAENPINNLDITREDQKLIGISLYFPVFIIYSNECFSLFKDQI